MRKLLLFIFLITSNCFTYEEKIYINRSGSGKVFINYSVPVFKKSGKSMISHLPVEREELEEKLKTKLISYELKPQKSILLNFEYKEVTAEFEFEKIESLKNKLLGLKKILKQNNQYILERNFQVLEHKLKENQIFSFIYDFIYRIIKEGYLKFEIQSPENFDLLTNYGEIPRPGMLFFFLPLHRLLELDKDIIWNIYIKVN